MNGEKKNCLTKWAFGIGSIALAISITALCRIEPITLDWMGVLVGALALLVTALIGWQILVALSIKEMAKKEAGRVAKEEIGHEIKRITKAAIQTEAKLYYNVAHYLSIHEAPSHAITFSLYVHAAATYRNGGNAEFYRKSIVNAAKEVAHMDRGQYQIDSALLACFLAGVDGDESAEAVMVKNFLIAPGLKGTRSIRRPEE